MIARIELTYEASKRAHELIKERGEGFYKELAAHLVSDSAPSLEHSLSSEYAWHVTGLVDADQDMAWLTAHGITFEVKNFKGTMPLTALLPDTRQSVQVHVQIPHIGLLLMNEVKLLEDCCTDVLQQHLNDSWRILCVCPPNAQRRPDYILGRTKEAE